MCKLLIGSGSFGLKTETQVWISWCIMHNKVENVFIIHIKHPGVSFQDKGTECQRHSSMKNLAILVMREKFCVTSVRGNSF